MQQPSCFISYCHADTNKSALNDLLNKLRDACMGIQYKCDIDNPPGASIEEFMKEIFNVETIVVICSPEYKEKINDLHSRVGKEFSYIIQRYNKYKEICKNNKTDDLASYEFAIIPIIITEDNNKIATLDAYPDWFQNELSLVYKRYTYLSPAIKQDANKTIKRQGKKLSNYEKILIAIQNSLPNIEIDNNSIINAIVGKTISLHSQRPITGSSIPLSVRKKRLIENTKAENNEMTLGSLFCVTKFYKDLVAQNKTVFVGRKGSGKTETIKQFCNEYKLKYKGMIKINTNDLAIESLLNRFLNEKNNLNTKISQGAIEATINDIDEMFTFEEFLRYTWMGFIYLSSIYRIACENLDQYKKEKFAVAYDFINKILEKIPSQQRFVTNRENSVYKALFEYAFAACIEFYNSIMSETRTESYAYLMADIAALNSMSNYIDFLLSKPVRNSFALTLSQCTKNIFLSLDGFDNYEEQRKGHRLKLKEGLNMSLISDFESAIIISLVNVVNQIKTSGDMELFEFYNKFDACLMVPFDRYMQLTQFKRDGFLYQDLMTSAIYKGYDLYDMYLKRIWFIANEGYREINNEIDRENLSRDLNECYFNLPTEITIRLENNTIKFPLFLYMLRYSFWRPRDIIDHIGGVFSALFDSNDNKLSRTITEESIKTSISNCSKKIVLKIIQEFKDVWLNMTDCLNKFRYKNAVMTYKEFEDFITKTSFSINVNNDNYTKINDIIKFLYEIGIIGLILSPKNKARAHTQYSQHQVFYSGRKPLVTLGEEIFSENQIFFNPVMYAPYNMNIKTDEILGINSWQILETLDMEIDYDYLNTPV